MRNLPKHNSGYNLPVILNHQDQSDDWSPAEYLCIRPFRGSFIQEEWGTFKPSGEMAPIGKEIAQNEICSFINRFSSEEEFDDLIEAQANIDYCDEIAMEFLSCSILFFGYQDYLDSWEEVAEAHFEFSNVELIALKAIYDWWCEHPLLGGIVYHNTGGRYSYLTHQWSVSVYYFKNPAISRNPKAKYIGEYRKG
jgi:hypothetical protein